MQVVTRLSAALLLATLTAQAAPPLPFTVELTADPWPPFNAEADGTHPGYMVELARQLSAPLGVEVSYVPRPWSRAISEVKAGRSSCLIGATPVEAPQFSFPRHSWFDSVYLAYVVAGDPWRYRDPSSFTGRMVGLVAGYDYGEVLASYQRSAAAGSIHREYGEQSLATNIRLLLQGSLDVVVENDQVMAYRLAQMGLTGQVRSAGSMGPPTPLFIACTPGDERLGNWLQAVDEGYQQALSDGRVEALRRAYGMAPPDEQPVSAD